MKEGHKSRIYVAILIGLLTFIIYLPALRNKLVNWDDDLYVTENFHIRSLNTSFFRWAFFSFYGSNWHPITWISHALDYAVWRSNPVGHHLTSILLHAINTSLVVLLTAQMLTVRKESTTDPLKETFLTERVILIILAVTGVFFGLHPVHVESVAWVSERKDLLCALFSLLTMLSYTTGIRRELQLTNRFGLSNRRYLFTLGLFLLALMSKPMAVTLPLVLLILDWYPIQRIASFKTFLAACVEKIPFFALSILSSLTTLLAQSSGGSIVSVQSVPLPTRVLVGIRAIVAYLGSIVVPTDLLPFYPYPRNVSLFLPEYALSLFFAVAATALAFFIVKREKLYLAAGAYYLVTLFPVLGVVQVGGQFMADRFLYLPSLSLFVILGVMTAWIWRTAGRIKWKIPMAQLFCPLGAMFLLATLSYATIAQISVWKTSIGLWSTVIRTQRDPAPLAYYNRGQAFMDINQVENAIRDYSAAITLNPFYQEAVYNRGIAYEKIGAYDLALRDYDKALELNPSNYQALNNRGILYGKYGSYDLSIECFNRALAINPRYPESYFNRGLTFSLIGKFRDAMEDFNRTIDLNPQFAQAYFQRGNIYLRMNQKMEAMDDFRKACDLGIKEACSAFR
jgi:protein O-mannosyl-transferase